MTSYFCCAHVGVPTVLIAMLRMLLGVTEFRLLRPYPQHWFSVSGTHMAGIYCESVTTIWQELLLVPCMYSVDYSCCSLTARLETNLDVDHFSIVHIVHGPHYIVNDMMHEQSTNHISLKNRA